MKPYASQSKKPINIAQSSTRSNGSSASKKGIIGKYMLEPEFKTTKIDIKQVSQQNNSISSIADKQFLNMKTGRVSNTPSGKVLFGYETRAA